MNEDRLKKIEDLLNRNFNAPEIAKILGIRKQAVYYYIWRYIEKRTFKK